MAGWSEGLKTAQGLASKANTATGGYLLGAGGGAAAGAALGGAYGGFSDNGSVAGGLAGGALLGAGVGAGINAGFRSLGSKKVGTMTEAVNPTVGATTASPAVRDVAATAGAGYQGTLPRGTNLAEHRAAKQRAAADSSRLIDYTPEPVGASPNLSLVPKSVGNEIAYTPTGIGAPSQDSLLRSAYDQATQSATYRAGLARPNPSAGSIPQARPTGTIVDVPSRMRDLAEENARIERAARAGLHSM